MKIELALADGKRPARFHGSEFLLLFQINQFIIIIIIISISWHRIYAFVLY